MTKCYTWSTLFYVVKVWTLKGATFKGLDVFKFDFAEKSSKGFLVHSVKSARVSCTVDETFHN